MGEAGGDGGGGGGGDGGGAPTTPPDDNDDEIGGDGDSNKGDKPVNPEKYDLDHQSSKFKRRVHRGNPSVNGTLKHFDVKILQGSECQISSSNGANATSFCGRADALGVSFKQTIYCGQKLFGL